MKNFNQFKIGNRVLIDERLLDQDLMEEGFVTGITSFTLTVKHRGTFIEYKCNPLQIYPIVLNNGILTSLGFSERNLTDSNGNKINDKVLITNEIRPGLWYLLSIVEKNKKYFLSIYENGKELIGSGYVDSLHKLQNLVSDITEERLEI